MKSFLNSILPLDEGQYIETITYEDPALIPELPELKHSIVDVRCTDNYKRQFIVEMQMYWTNSFKNRMLFNSGKAYVKQIEKGHKYAELHPVYGLSLVNDIFMTDEQYKDKYYHHYRLVHEDIPGEIIDGIELIFIELPKFKAQNFVDKRMSVLWLRFLTEIGEDTETVPKELLEDESIKAALEQLQISAFSKAELAYYDKYWDKVRVEKAAIDEALTRARIAEEKENKAKKAEEKARQAEEEALKAGEEAKKAKEKALKAEAEAKRSEEEAKRSEEEAKRSEEEARRSEKEAQRSAIEAINEAEKIKQNMLEIAKYLIELGIDDETIMKRTSLSRDEIENLKK